MPKEMKIVRGLNSKDGSAARVRVTRDISTSEEPTPPLYIAQRECERATITLRPLDTHESRFLSVVLSSDSEPDSDQETSADPPPPKKCLSQSEKSSPNWVVSAAHFETVKKRLQETETEVQQLKKKIATLQKRVIKIESDRDVFERCFLAGQESHRQHRVCKICYTRDYDIILMPCLHQGLCKTCHRQLPVNRQGKKKCPFCNRTIEKVGGLYYA